jgi:hypothetical protein
MMVMKQCISLELSTVKAVSYRDSNCFGMIFVHTQDSLSQQYNHFFYHEQHATIFYIENDLQCDPSCFAKRSQRPETTRRALRNVPKDQKQPVALCETFPKIENNSSRFAKRSIQHYRNSAGKKLRIRKKCILSGIINYLNFK